MIPKIDRNPEPGRENWREFTIVESANPAFPVGGMFLAAVELADNSPVDGTPVNRQTQTEYLAASGTTTGSSSVFNLAQEAFELFDGCVARVRFHTNTVAPFTLNVGFTGGLPVIDAQGGNQSNYSANTWATFIYSAPLGAWVAQGAISDVRHLAPIQSPAFTGTPTAPQGTDYSTQRLRNIYAGTADMTAGTTALPNGVIYLVYEV